MEIPVYQQNENYCFPYSTSRTMGALGAVNFGQEESSVLIFFVPEGLHQKDLVSLLEWGESVPSLTELFST